MSRAGSRPTDGSRPVAPMPHASRRLPVGWAVALAFDFLATVLTALVLCAVGLLLPGITEDYGPAAGPTSPRAVAFFLAALGLVASLGGTAVLRSRAGTGRSRALALWLSAVRLGLIVLSAAAFVVYGVVTVELA
ncbi:hypothetical protein NRK68_30920 [Streptomyces yangpuensis]|uniref:RDD family protein n=1 Tax=Streptomyces yangpuensis TaxID=1648182 RepID=A0ABY5Q4R1_9ACTN|nr:MULTISPECIES: hypothetical protein [Streptomyces]MBZ9599686.1 hypothetical protein [Streptomyces erythrochromogenes]UUY51255.1 hypothetical protein NRK68_30920 [Streptomyces yangpuensis]